MSKYIFSDLATPGSDWEAIDNRMSEIVAEHPNMERRCHRGALVNRAINDTIGPKVAAFRKRFNRIES